MTHKHESSWGQAVSGHLFHGLAVPWALNSSNMESRDCENTATHILSDTCSYPIRETTSLVYLGLRILRMLDFQCKHGDSPGKSIQEVYQVTVGPALSFVHI